MSRYESLYLSVTGRCNLQCGHCYLLDSRRSDNPPLDKIEKLLSEAARYGIKEVKVTGGEPFIRDDINEIFDLIHKYGLHLNAVCTNGTLMNQSNIDAMMSFNPVPYVKLSFDGIGFHDRLRNREGLTQDTLDLISKLKKSGLKPRVNYCLNRANVDVAPESVIELYRRGVDWIRFLRFSTTERVVQSNLQDLPLLHDEYFEAILRIIHELADTDVTSVIIFTNVGWMIPAFRKLSPYGIFDSLSCAPLCTSLTKEIYVDSDGFLFPCPTLSTAMRHIGWTYENAYTDKRPFDELLEDSECVRIACSTVNDLKNSNSECLKCRYRNRCHGGCRVIALAQAYVDKPNDEITYYETNPFSCYLYNNNYVDRMMKAAGYQLTPLI